MRELENNETLQIIELLKDISAVFQTAYAKDQNNIVFDLIDVECIDNMIDTLENPNHNNTENNGLDLRVHFASLAMQAIRSNPNNSTNTPDFVAEQAVKLADALIIEIQKPFNK